MDVIVFGAHNCFDSWRHRIALLRIPEVSLKIRAAQKTFDGFVPQPFDLISYFSAHRAVYCQNLPTRAVMVALVQAALFERHLRFHPWPKYVVGPGTGDSVFSLVFGQNPLDGFIEQCVDFQRLGPMSYEVRGRQKRVVDSGLLPPLQFVTYALKVVGTRPKGETLGAPSVDLTVKLDELMIGRLRDTVIAIGALNELKRWRAVRRLTVVDSLKLDPLLPWYWNGEQALDMAVAQ